MTELQLEQSAVAVMSFNKLNLKIEVTRSKIAFKCTCKEMSIRFQSTLDGSVTNTFECNTLSPYVQGLCLHCTDPQNVSCKETCVHGLDDLTVQVHFHRCWLILTI